MSIRSSNVAEAEAGTAKTADSPTKGALGFFPWVCISAVDVGEFQLRPWHRDEPDPAWALPLLEPYRDGSLRPIKDATVVGVSGDFSDTWDSDTVERFFQLRDIVSFVALSAREFFSATSRYVNDHTFQAFVQPFDAAVGAGTVRVTRRRDGSATTMVAAAVHRVSVPDHVSPTDEHNLNENALKLLVRGWQKPETWEWLSNALALFTLASTDSTEVREHTEVVLIVAALQAAMGLNGGTREDELTAAFVAQLRRLGIASVAVTDSPRFKQGSYTAKSGEGLLELWFRDLYRTRGAVAHGRTTTKHVMRWTVKEHLLLASYVFPLVVFARLADDGVHMPDDDDGDKLAAFEALLCMSDCFASEEPYPHYKSFLWPSVINEATLKRKVQRIVAAHGG